MMEEVNLDSKRSGYFFLNGQKIYIQSNYETSNLSGNSKGDIVQQALNGLTGTINPQPEEEANANNQISNFGDEYLVSNKDEDDGRIVQLSISEDFPIQLLNSSGRKELDLSSDPDSSLFENVFSTSDLDNTLSVDDLNSFLAMSPNVINEHSTDQNDVQHTLNESSQISAHKFVPITTASVNSLNTNTVKFPANINPTTAVNKVKSKKIPKVKTRVIAQGENRVNSAATKVAATLQNKATNGNSDSTAITNKPTDIFNGKKLVYINKVLGRTGVPQQFPFKFRNTKGSQDAKKHDVARKICVVPSEGNSLSNNQRNLIASQVPQIPLNNATENKSLVVNNNSQAKQNISLVVNKGQLGKIVKRKTLEPPISSQSLKPAVKKKTVGALTLLDTSFSDKQPIVFNVNNIEFATDANLSSKCLNETNLSYKLSDELNLNDKSLSEIFNTEVPLAFSNSNSQKSIEIENEPKSQDIPPIINKEIEKPAIGKKSRERLTDSQLNKIAAALKDSCQNGKNINSSSTLYDTETNTRIVCRVVFPDKKDNSQEVGIPNIVKPVHKPKKRGRPGGRVALGGPKAKNPNAATGKEQMTQQQNKKLKQEKKVSRTRSGRLSRPPKHIIKDFRRIKESMDDRMEYSESESDNVENAPVFHPLPRIRSLQRKRRISTEFKCPNCGKYYLGRKKMFAHFMKYPDHQTNYALLKLQGGEEQNKPKESIKSLLRKFWNKGERLSVEELTKFLSLFPDDIFISAVKERFTKCVWPWAYLMARQSGQKFAVAGLLADLSSILKAIPPDIIQMAPPGEYATLAIDDDRLCQALNISPGHYLPNDSCLHTVECAPPVKPKLDTTISPDWPSFEHVNDTSHLALQMEVDKLEVDDDHLSKEDSSVLLEILGDKSSLESVDQIVSERLNFLIPEGPLEVASDPMPQSILSRVSSDDLLCAPSVSASTEDLIKTLETLTPHLPPVSTPTDFDFGVLSSDFITDR